MLMVRLGLIHSYIPNNMRCVWCVAETNKCWLVISGYYFKILKKYIYMKGSRNNHFICCLQDMSLGK